MTYTLSWCYSSTELKRPYSAHELAIFYYKSTAYTHLCAYIAYPLYLFEEGSVTNMFIFIISNVFGFKAHGLYV